MRFACRIVQRALRHDQRRITLAQPLHRGERSLSVPSQERVFGTVQKCSGLGATTSSLLDVVCRDTVLFTLATNSQGKVDFRWGRCARAVRASGCGNRCSFQVRSLRACPWCGIARVAIFFFFGMGGGSENPIQKTSLGDPSPRCACQLEGVIFWCEAGYGTW